MNKNRCIRLLLVTVMVAALLCLFPMPTHADDAIHGSCGNNLKFTVQDGILTISGFGPMDNYNSSTAAPWTYNNIRFHTVIIEEGVSTIGRYAFQGFRIQSITIPSTLTGIGDAAFDQCSVGSEILISKNLTSISESAFLNASVQRFTVDSENPCFSSDASGVLFNKDKTVLIKAPQSLEGAYVVADGVTHISQNAFCASGIVALSLPDSLRTIGEDAFSGCALELTTYDHALYLGDSENPYRVLFSAIHKDITECTIHQDTRFIYSSAFRGCTWLHEIVIPEGVISIGDLAFANCSTAVSVSLPNSLESIGSDAFSYCNGITDIVVPEGVASIGDFAFGCPTLTSLSLPDSLVHIGKQDFSDCRYLTYNELDGVRYLGNSQNPYLYLVSALDQCIPSCTIPDTTKFIGANAFYGCESLISVTISNSVTHIGSSAFYNCNAMSDLVFGNQVAHIADQAFAFCDSLSEVSFPDSVSRIEISAFQSCDSLTNVSIPGSVSYISPYAFVPCSKLEGIWVDDSNPCYSSDSRGVLFNKDQTQLICAPGGITGSYTIPDTVTTIGDEAFSYCSSLTNIVIPDSVTHIGERVFWECDALKSAHIGSGVPSISRQMFLSCNDLICVTIPESVATIRECAFSGCFSLICVTIPDSVYEIGYCAFQNCTDLWHMLYTGTQEQWEAVSVSTLENNLLENATWHFEANGDEIIDIETKLCALCCEHSYEAVETIEPGCGSEGHTNYTCTICGHSYTGDTVPPTGQHTFDHSCDPDCNVCGETRQTEHTPGPVATEDEAQICTICGVVLAPAVESSDAPWILVAAGVILAAGAAALVLILIKKKKK